jgi:hypothetical protein
MNRAIFPLAAAAAIALAGCGASAPARSAPGACASFAAWVKAQDGRLDSGQDMTGLRQAVAEAPSGSLYSDLASVRDIVTYALAHPAQDGGLLGADSQTGTDVQLVQDDCASVNPG